MAHYQLQNSVSNYNAFVYEPCNWYFHFHKNIEILYVFQGVLEATVDGVTETIKKNEFAIILPGQIHAYRSAEDTRVWIGVFSEDYAKDFSLFIKGKRATSIKFSCDTNILVYLQENLLIAGKPEIFTLKACIYAVCAQYARNAKLVINCEVHSELIYKMLQYISEHFREDITLRNVAAMLGYDFHYLSRCQHEMFHINFRQFINIYRIEYAKRLILEEKMPITEAAMECGFQSVRSFNRAFKNITGFTPSCYSKRHI